jgi:hypothetical protein
MSQAKSQKSKARNWKPKAKSFKLSVRIGTGTAVSPFGFRLLASNFKL